MEKLSWGGPPEVRFRPKDDELIENYLKRKITGNDKEIFFVPEIEFYKHEPWDLPDKSGIDSRDQEWFFFDTPSLKHQNGRKKNRATKEGFWKTTGNDKEIKFRGSLIGMKKILVYHRACTPNREGTKWVMHEYRTAQEEFNGTHPGQKPFVLCRLFNNGEESNEGGSAKSDVTVTVQSNNYNYHNADAAKNQGAELTSTEIDFYPLNVSNDSSPGDSPSSPNNIAVDKETLKNIASYTDNGSCGGSDANAQVDHQVDQDLDKSEPFETGFIHPLELYCNSLSPSALTSVTPAVSSPTIPEGWCQFMLNWPRPTAYDYWDLGHNNGSCGGSDANAQAYSYFINPYLYITKS